MSHSGKSPGSKKVSELTTLLAKCAEIEAENAEIREGLGEAIIHDIPILTLQIGDEEWLWSGSKEELRLTVHLLRNFLVKEHSEGPALSPIPIEVSGHQKTAI